MTFKTEQEEFWAGDFGNEYISRNNSDAMIASNVSFFAKSLNMAKGGIDTCIEFGANIGMNLKALKRLYPAQEQYGIEINSQAAQELSKNIPANNVYNCSILDFSSKDTWDLVLIKGVLIHLNPEELPEVYDKLITACGKYFLVAEYFNPTPVKITYRGHEDRLFKRDFAGEILDRYPQMQLIDYGFVYKRDPVFPQDNINWFLLERKSI